MSKTVIKRLRFFLAVTLLIMLVLVFRLAQLQIVYGEDYEKRSEDNMLRVLPITAPRGEIFDSNGERLVSNRTGFTVSLGEIPTKDRESVIKLLSEILDREVEDIEKDINNQRYRRYQPIKLKTDVDMETVARIEERRLDLPGVMIEVEPIRFYVDGWFAPHIMGQISTTPAQKSDIERWASEGYEYKIGDSIGQDGIERAWEPYLRGNNGEILVEVNAWGRMVGVRDRREPVPGNDLYLTLDSDLQRDVQRFLREGLELREQQGYKNLRGAAAVVLELNSGRILAMASVPDYDLSTYSQDFNELSQDTYLTPLVNRAINGLYPGGSTFKMVTATAALEEGKVTPAEVIRCTGSLTRYGSTKTCYMGSVHGPTNLYRALTRSCNVYFYEMGVRVGIDSLAYYAGEYGFGRRAGLTDIIPRESAGKVASREVKFETYPNLPWYGGETMDAAIGQGFHQFTPLQLANYAAIIANGGLHYKPYLVEQAKTYEEEVVWQASPEFHKVNVSDQTLQLLRNAMEGVCQPGGTAGFLARLPIPVAGKTGSAQHGIRGLETHGVFIGYAPAHNPEIAFAVVVEYGGTGGGASAPIAERIVQSYFNLLEEEEPEEGEEHEDFLEEENDEESTLN
ncbi:penicillin-binding protein 2 [Candidatus Contubernalis alkaliaceticus]|uniref:penicillin-binding protein 2 n=1 Tax=Candidatus Contubernalis alkaliaceticus TaxID=338645 RepID=UPI001F4BD06F|nr:penicillin-binding protein 2 [Candidatus Contubernalis alkalaceticus]UNC90922.1 penicillin-binding protein 2 [Candidatus Contubernalis alkalaceticus]